MVCSAVMTCAAATTGSTTEVRHRARGRRAPRTVICTSSVAAITGPARTAILSRRQAGPVVHGVDLVGGKTLEQALLHHDLPAAAAFLRGLEDHVGGAVEIARLGEVARRAEQHGGVAVVAAGMHPALMS